MRNNSLGYVTATMIQSYDCPRKYFYEYVEGWKPIRPSANLVFGSIFHESIAEEFLTDRSASELFLDKWAKVEELEYSNSDTHESLKNIGFSLLEKVSKTEVYQRVIAVEKAYQTRLSDNTVLKGKLDLIYDSRGEEVLLDWKTSSRAFLDSRPDLDDQLTAYSMLSGIQRVAYGVLVKKKNPEVYFLHAERNRQDYADYQVKVMKVVSDIEAGFFFRKPSIYCGFCPYVALCRNQKDKIEKELNKTSVEDRYQRIECEKVNMF